MHANTTQQFQRSLYGWKCFKFQGKKLGSEYQGTCSKKPSSSFILKSLTSGTNF